MGWIVFKNKFQIICLCSFLFLHFKAQCEQKTFAVKQNNDSILVKNIKELKGELHYQIFDCSENEIGTWQELTLLHSAEITIDNKEINISEPLEHKAGYCIRVFQDLNQNEQLDMSTNGVPKEATGFSNNPSLFKGAPKPAATWFSYQTGEQVIINMNNKKRHRRNKRK